MALNIPFLQIPGTATTDSPSHSDDCATLYNRTAQILSSPAKCFVRLYMTHSSVNTSCMEFNIDKRRCLKMPPLRSVRKDTLTNMNEMLPLTRGAMPHKTCFFDPYTCRKCWLHCPCHEKARPFTMACQQNDAPRVKCDPVSPP